MNREKIKSFIVYKSCIFVLGLTLSAGCNYSDLNNLFGTNKTNTVYNIEIDYSSLPLEDKRSLAGGDTVVIGFVGDFSNDTVEVYKNNKFQEKAILTSDWQDEGAGHILLDSYYRLNNVGIRINGGPLIFIETNKRDYHINLAFRNDQVNVKFYKYLPALY